MTFADAYEQIQLVLAEEMASPTLTYSYLSSEWPLEIRHVGPAFSELGLEPAKAARLLLLPEMRKRRPRPVLKDFACWQMESARYDQMLSIYKEVPECERRRLLSALLAAVLNAPMSNPAPLPLPWNVATSPMPLLTEFLVRNGQYEVLMYALGESGNEYPTADLILATRQLEEMLAFNSNLFTERQLGFMFRRLCSLWEMGLRQNSPDIRGIHRTSPIRPNPHYREGWQMNGEELADSMDAIKEQCRDARSACADQGRKAFRLGDPLWLSRRLMAKRHHFLYCAARCFKNYWNSEDDGTGI